MGRGKLNPLDPRLIQLLVGTRGGQTGQAGRALLDGKPLGLLQILPSLPQRHVVRQGELEGLIKG